MGSQAPGLARACQDFCRKDGMRGEERAGVEPGRGKTPHLHLEGRFNRSWGLAGLLTLPSGRGTQS